MKELRDKWEKMPRAMRGTALVGLGSLAMVAGLIARENIGDSHETMTDEGISFALGVKCVSETAKVSYYQSGDMVRMRCVSEGGMTEDVTEVDNLLPYPSKLDVIRDNYNEIIAVHEPGQAIHFDLQGSDVVATIYDKVVNDSDTNDPSMGIFRVTNTSL